MPRLPKHVHPSLVKAKLPLRSAMLGVPQDGNGRLLETRSVESLVRTLARGAHGGPREERKARAALDRTLERLSPRLRDDLERLFDQIVDGEDPTEELASDDEGDGE